MAFAASPVGTTARSPLYQWFVGENSGEGKGYLTAKGTYYVSRMQANGNPLSRVKEVMYSALNRAMDYSKSAIKDALTTSHLYTQDNRLGYNEG